MKDEMQKKAKPRKKDRKELIQYINLQLATMGQPIFEDDTDAKGKLASKKFFSLTEGLVNSFREKSKLLKEHLSPVDARIQCFLDDYLKDVKDVDPASYRLPNNTFILNQKGIARELSLPANGNTFKSDLVSSHRLKQGILNNPAKDKRTTVGTFHIVAGSLPVPLDKKEVPELTFAHLLSAAVNPPEELKNLPFTSTMDEQAKVMLSLLMRPVVCPEVPGVTPEKRMEIRFFAPGNLVSNLDFVESIFGNAGDPNLPENDSALDVEGWTGHTGTVILATHLTKMRKKDVGLPHYDDATERQRNDGMCWKDESELYNDGGAFKLTCRSDKGVVVTLIADNYYGYSKKEVKTQIGYAANMYGLVEEEHAGGAIAYPRGIMSENVFGKAFSDKLKNSFSFDEAMNLLGDSVDVKPEGYAIDKKYADIVYIQENADIDIQKNAVTWTKDGNEQKLTLSPDKTYVHPSGHKFNLLKHPAQPLWRIVNTQPEGMFCHKPCTVSGGGKSEISKSMQNAIKYGTYNIVNLEEDFKKADEIIDFDFSNRFKDGKRTDSRSFLSTDRALGSAVKLLTPSDQYTDEYNEMLRAIPDHIRSLVLFVKRLYRNDKEKGNWKDYMTAEIVNGRQGTTLLYKHNKVIASYARIGFDEKGHWLLHKLRSDFVPSAKIQMEDDITASVTLPASQLTKLNAEFEENKSVKITKNCEAHLFQRPDEAIIRGYDVEAEEDLVTPGTFLTNYEPLSKSVAVELIEDAVNFDKYTQPVKDFVTKVADSEDEELYFSVPSHPRIVEGAPTKNPRYLQRNIYTEETFDSYLAEVGVRLHRKIETKDPVYYPVNAVLPGRRNNPVDKKNGIRPLSVYNPIHYQELPELFMDFICSLTGKSPSTTGAGSEGALTKGPFNMLAPTSDLNNALLSYILTEYHGFSSAAGYVGQNRFDHDISILVPEIWSRLEPADRDPKLLIEKNCLEKLEDFDHNGQKVLASRLGYRITENFAFRCMNRLFDEPLAVFNDKMLKPELQGLDDFVDGINNIVEAQEKVAKAYFADGSIDAATPPLKILLHIMAYGQYEGKDISDPELRKYFDRDYVINSDWYKARLVEKQRKDVELHTAQVESLKAFAAKGENAEKAVKMDIAGRLAKAEALLAKASADSYIDELVGTIGADLIYK